MAKVSSALAPYAGLAEEGEDHDEPDFKELKDELENVSSTMYDAIVAMGRAASKDAASKPRSL